MSWLKRSEVWFPLGLVLLIAVGAVLLNNPTCQSLDERDWRWFAKANAWRSTFDAVSAACGVGLLTHDINEEYTAVGKWTLSVIGVAGAALWMMAVLSASRRFWRASGSERPLPPGRRVLAAFLTLILLSVPVTMLCEWLTRTSSGAPAPADGLAGSAWRGISASASLGWLPGHPAGSYTWIYAVVGLAGGLGWMVWLLPLARTRREGLRSSAVVKLAGSYVLYLLVVGGVMFLLESPRGQSRRAGTTSVTSAQLTGLPALARYGRSLDATVCAATAGLPVEDVAEENVTDASKMVLAGTILIGSLPGSPGGGIKWTLFAWFISGGLAATCIRRQSLAPAAVRRFTLAAGYMALLLGLTCITAFGLLVIESRTAHSYQEQPTFAAAFLDASSAVGGANLSTGIAHAVTDQNLSRGISQGVDAYRYGMALLMAAMVIGRTLLVIVLGWLAGLRLTESESVRLPEAL
jgi:Trk-type K+ transport system membrane component